MPMSSSTSRPSGVTSTLPGCGSAWKTPSTSTCLRYAANSASASGAPSSSSWPSGSQVGDLPARDVLHGQHPAGGQVRVRLGHHDRGVRAEDAADGDQVLGLAAVVELVDQRPAELLQQVAEAVPAAEVGVRVEQLGDLGEHLHVLARPGSRMPGRCTLTTTSRPSRSVARCTCPSEAAASGRWSKVGKTLESRTPSSVLTISSTSSNGNGSTLVLQPGQRLDVRRREQVDAGGHQLAELHEGRAHRLEVVGEPGRGLRVALLERLVGEDGVDPGGAHEIPPPVPGEEGRDLAVALQVTGPDLGCHGASRLAARGGVRPGRGRGGRLVYRSVIRGSPFSRPVPLMEQAPLRGVPPL